MQVFTCRSTMRSCRSCRRSSSRRCRSHNHTKWAQLRIDALNRALVGVPTEKTRYHICWGSWSGPHQFDVEMKDFIDLLLQVNVGAYSFEAANVRHEHEWKVWKNVTRLPAGKKLLPRRHQPRHQCGRAPGTDCRPAHSFRRHRRQGECAGLERLRLCAKPVCAPRSPLDHVGETQGHDRGRKNGERPFVGKKKRGVRASRLNPRSFPRKRESSLATGLAG